MSRQLARVTESVGVPSPCPELGEPGTLSDIPADASPVELTEGRSGTDGRIFIRHETEKLMRISVSCPQIIRKRPKHCHETANSAYYSVSRSLPSGDAASHYAAEAATARRCGGLCEMALLAAAVTNHFCSYYPKPRSRPPERSAGLVVVTG